MLHRATGASIATACGGFALAALLGAAPARAGECTVTPFELLNELSFPSWIGGASGFDQPFATVFHFNLSFQQSTGCGGPCPTNNSPGESECGNLVTTPIVADEIVAGFLPMDVIGYEAGLLANGTWEFSTGAFIEAPESVTTFATMNTNFGHREVFDVTSAASGPQPFRLRVRESVLFPAEPNSCPGINRLPLVSRTGHLRVRPFGSVQILDTILGAPSGVPPDRTEIIPVESNGEEFQRVIQEWDFELEIPANTVLFVDVFYDGVGGNFQAPVADLLTGLECPLTIIGASWLEPDGGIQLQVSPGPGVSAVARSGIVYAPVPEPGGFASGLAVLVALACARRRAPDPGRER